MKPAPCYLCARLPHITSTPASTDGHDVAILVQCPAHLLGQVSLYGSNFGAVHRAALLAWNDYQDTMRAMNPQEAA